MSRPVSLGAAALLALASLAGGEAGAGFHTGNLAFALNLHKALAAAGGNTACSPYSVSQAMCLCRAGARGDTAAQIDAAFGWADVAGDPHAGWAPINARLAAAEGLTVDVANRLYVQRDYRFLDDYLALAERHYGAGAVAADFKADPEAERRRINAWVNERTREKIPELIKPEPPVIRTDTRAVLVNALYFKATWRDPFTESATANGPFHLDGEREVSVPLMRNHLDYYAHGEGVHVVWLPYGEPGRRSHAHMLLVVPEAVDGLAAVEASLTPETVAAWDAAKARANVTLVMPRFTTRCHARLKEQLRALGVVDAFTLGQKWGGRADFSGMTGTTDLNIADVVHETWIAVDEKGTEAAAATAVVMMAGCAAPPKRVTVTADRPFLYLIRDDATGTVLFVGRVADPSAGAE